MFLEKTELIKTSCLLLPKCVFTCGKWSINGPKDIPNTVTTVIASLIRFVIEKEYQGVLIPSAEDTVKQYDLSRYTTYTGAIYKYICFKFNRTAKRNAPWM